MLSICTLGVAASAQAAGFEVAPIGARDGGRGGASIVGADSAMGLFYNPATLLQAPRFIDGALALHAHVGQLCFTRQTVVEDAAGGRSGGERQPEVCTERGVALLPETATSMRLGVKQRFAIGLGVSVPLPRARKFRFGDLQTATIATPDGRIPAPSRYLLVDENIVQVFPTLGVAYELHPRVRLGASFGWGITSFDFTQTTFARTIILPPDAAEAASDIAVRTTGRDAFTPRFQLGVVAQPLAKLPLWLGLTFTHTSDITVDDAKVRIRGLSTVYSANDALISGVLANTPQPNIAATVDSVKVNIPQTSTLAGGLRYANMLAAPADKVGDRLSNERFDVELDALVTFSKRVDQFDARLPPTTVTVPSPSPFVADVNLELPERFTVMTRWKNQLGLRLGGDYSVLPGRLALRAGLQYESSGIRHGYEQLLFLPVRQWALSAGLTVRIIEQLDASLTYSHFFVHTQDVSARSASLRRQVSGAARAGDDEIVNAGTFTQQLDAVALELNTRF